MSTEVRTILASELHQLASDLALHAPGLDAGSEEAAAQCLGLCERLGHVAGMIEAPALQEVAIFLISNIPALLGNTARARAPAELCADLELCLLEGVDSERWLALAASLADTRWPASMEAAAAEEVARGLRPLAAEDEEPTPVAAPTIAAEELTLCPPEDVGLATLQAFFHEAPLQATQLNQLFTRLDDRVADEDIAAARRLVHTLKGSSALCGLHAIAHLANALETLLEHLAGCERLPARIRNRLIEAGDMIEQLIEAASDGTGVPGSLPALIGNLYSDRTSSDDDCDAAPADEIDAAAPARLPQPTERVEEVEQKELAPTLTPTLNVPTTLIDENLRRAGEINVAIGQLSAHASATLERANRLVQQLALVQSQVYELETLVDTRGIPAMRAQQRLDAEEFDPLELDEYTALHSLSRAFAESTLDSRELSRELGDELLKLQNLLTQHARLGRELTDSVMSTRLVPVASIAPRLERIVRQTARHAGREVELEIVGRELSIDTDILTGLVEPLMHALRNAVDHGIEPTDERLAAGKPAAGRIRLSFRREGNRIEVVCADDGRGLDYDAIERRAVERGLLARGQKVSQSDLASLVFAPGFSTRDAVTEISGRGVGMDVVRASIERLKGTTTIDSRTGAGCTLTLRLPLSLTSAHALFVVVGAATYGLPSTTVDQVLYSDAGRVVQFGEQYAFEYAGQVSPLYALGALLGQPTRSLADLISEPLPLVIVSGDTGPIALVVDRAADSRQVVIKGLSPMLPTLPGVAGACVLSDGGIGVILEVRELLRQPLTAPTTRRAPVSAPMNVRNVRHALVVDDSLSARRALAQLLTDCGYDVATAVDGLDAIARIEERTPDVVLVDLEMPRMNGLELTAHLRGKPNMQSLPIVMITSRGAQKHRSQALRVGVTEYLTKPYLEHELLDRLLTLVPP